MPDETAVERFLRLKREREEKEREEEERRRQHIITATPDEISTPVVDERGLAERGLAAFFERGEQVGALLDPVTEALGESEAVSSALQFVRPAVHRVVASGIPLRELEPEEEEQEQETAVERFLRLRAEREELATTGVPAESTGVRESLETAPFPSPEPVEPPEADDELSTFQGALRSTRRGQAGLVQSIGGTLQAGLPMPPELERQGREIFEQAGLEFEPKEGAPLQRLGRYLERIATEQLEDPRLAQSRSVEEGGVELRNPKWWVENLPGEAQIFMGQIGLSMLMPNKKAKMIAFVAPTAVRVGGAVFLQTRDLLLEQGMDRAEAENNARGAAYVAAVGSTMLEYFGPAAVFAMNRVPGAMSHFTTTLAGRAAKLGLGAGTESVTEVAQEVWESVSQYIFTRAPEVFADLPDRIKAAAGMGFVLGGAGGAVLGGGRDTAPVQEEEDVELDVTPAEVDAAIRGITEAEVDQSKIGEPPPPPPPPAVELASMRGDPRTMSDHDLRAAILDISESLTSQDELEGTIFGARLPSDDLKAALENDLDVFKAEVARRAADPVGEFVAAQPEEETVFSEVVEAIEKSAAVQADEAVMEQIAAGEPIAKHVTVEGALVSAYPTADIAEDAYRFQYKRTGEHGITSQFKNLKTFDPQLGGVIQVWLDPEENQVYVINGHHRLALAKRTGQETMNVMWIQAKDAAEARKVGALINIAEQQGTPVDAAKLMREGGYTVDDIEAMNVPLTLPLVRDAIALATLHPAIFSAVTTGDMRPNRGVAIGSSGLSHTEQIAVVRLVDAQESTRKNPITDSAVRELAEHAAGAPTISVEQETLFGTEVFDQSLAVERAELTGWIDRQLQKDARTFKFPTEGGRAERLAERGVGDIDVERSAEISEEITTLRDIFHRDKNAAATETAKLLNEGSMRSASEQESISAVRQDILAKLLEILPTAIGGVGVSGEAGGTEGSGFVSTDLFGNETLVEHEPGVDPQAEAGAVRAYRLRRGPVESTLPQVQERWEGARGVPRRGLRSRVLNGIEHIRSVLELRHFEQLNIKGNKKHAIAADILRTYEAVPEWAKITAVQEVSRIEENLDPDQQDLLTRLLALPDIIRSINEGLYKGKPLPFGYPNLEAVETDLRIAKDAAAADPDVTKALEKRHKLVRTLTERLVDLELLKPETLQNVESYYHRQVIEHFQAERWESPGRGSKDLRLRKKGFQKERTGGGDFNTQYRESEYAFIADALESIGKAESLQRIDKSLNIMKGLRGQATAINRARMELVDPAGMAGYRQRIAIGNQQLGIMALNGQLDYGPEWTHVGEGLADAYEAWLAEKELAKEEGRKVSTVGAFAFIHPDWFPFLNHLVTRAGGGSQQAAGIFKANNERTAYTKERLEAAGEFRTWEDVKPEGYTVWQPKQGARLFPGLAIADQVLRGMESRGDELSRENLREALIMGGPEEQWMLPTEVAEVLDNITEGRQENAVERLWAAGQSSWKQWTLFSPPRAAKYFLNNLSGDLDIVLAYNPRIAAPRRVGRAAHDRWNHLHGKATGAMQQELNRGLRKGVLNSGLTPEEIPDIANTGAFKTLASDDPNVVQKVAGGYWRGVKNFNVWREDALRLSAWRWFNEQFAAGKTPTDLNYAASNPNDIDAIWNDTNNADRVDDVAAKLARELVGDYGNISQSGLWIRRHMIPFYSWMEINAPRYVRMLKNNAHVAGKLDPKLAARTGGIVAARVTSKFAFKTAGLMIKANILFAAINAWNHLMWPEEEEKLRQKQREPHIIIGVDEETGLIQTLRFEGALADALEWIDLQDLPQDITDVTSGKDTFTDKLADAAKGPATRFVQAFEPFTKTLFELAAQQSTFPRLFREGATVDRGTLPIRDRGEHIARTVALDKLYKIVTNKPRPPGFYNPVNWVLTYQVDPGEVDYQLAKRMVVDWQRENNRDSPQISPTDRSNALYYHKKASQWGDLDRAEFWFKKYVELGGTEAGLQQSLNRSAPMGGLSADNRAEFLESLDEDERRIITDGEAWWKQVHPKAGQRVSRARTARPASPRKR